MAELAGVMVGNYFLLECLEREGMVETYRARPTTHGGYDVVLRIFRPRFPDPTGFQEHFAAEVEKVWRCHHPHIEPLIEFGAGEELLFCATRLREDETLEAFLKRNEDELEALPLPLVARLIEQLCGALHYAHEHHIAHGNIQPGSILVQDREHLLVTNFSMKHAYQEGEIAITRVEEGNAAYMAPEQAVGMLSPASDIYSVGVLLFRMLTGQLPYTGESAGDIALQHANEPIPSLRALRPDLPESVEMVARVALAKTPAARFPTATALADALQSAVNGDTPPLVTAIPRRHIPVRARRTAFTWSRALTLISTLAILGILMGSLVFFAVNPFHIEDLPGLPFPNLNSSGSLRVNPGSAVGVTPTPRVTSAPFSTPNAGNFPPGKSRPTPALSPTSAVGVTVTPGVTATPFPCVTGTLLIDGSPYLQPLLQKAGQDYAAQCTGLTMKVGGVGLRALNMVQRGRIDVAASDVTALASRNLTDRPIGGLLYALIANPGVSVTGLSSAQIQGIYGGQITNWAQVGGPDLAIKLIFPPQNSPLNAIFRAFVLKGAPESARGITLKKDRPDLLAQAVAQTPGAIGYVPLFIAKTVSVQPLAIDGNVPGAQTLLQGAYPFWSVEHLYTLGDGTTPAQNFAQFLGQETSTFLQFDVVPGNRISPGLFLSHLPGPQY